MKHLLLFAWLALAAGCARQSRGPELPRELGISHEEDPSLAGTTPHPVTEPCAARTKPPAAFISSTSPHWPPVAAHIKMPGGYGRFELVGGGAFAAGGPTPSTQSMPAAQGGSPGQLSGAPGQSVTGASARGVSAGIPQQSMPGTFGASLPPGNGIPGR